MDGAVEVGVANVAVEVDVANVAVEVDVAVEVGVADVAVGVVVAEVVVDVARTRDGYCRCVGSGRGGACVADGCDLSRLLVDTF